MSLAAVAVQRRAVTYFATFLVIVAGIASFFSLGQLEDPEFTVKTAVITTSYPGATPEEVELEVTDLIETKIQELKQIKWIESFSRAGVSQVKVEVLPSFWGDALQPVWDQMRRKVREIETELPPGAARPQINDDFGDVFGFQLALTGDGFAYRDLERFAKELRKELSVVDGVARVDLWGVQREVVYLDVRQSQLSQLGLSDESLENTLQGQNLVVDAGSFDLQSKRFRIAPTGAFASPEDIADLLIRPSALDTLQAGRTAEKRGLAGGAELIRIRDIGTIRRGYAEPPVSVMRYSNRAADGTPHTSQPALGLSITNKPGVNIVDVGYNIERRLDELAPLFPVGIDLHRVHWQSELVDEAVKGFIINFAEALAIVLVVLTLFMGWRMGLIIGGALIVTVLGTFIFMALFGIDLQRMSLGALVIALGMMVDNAIVVADGMAVRLQKGMDRTQAAIEAATKPSMPLLAATIIAVMAFYPIAASPESTGEYCLSLFTVVAISLLFSWLVSVTLTPLQCIDMLPAPKPGSETADPYRGRLFIAFRGVVEGAVRRRWLTLGLMAGLFVAAVVGFGEVRQLFFPPSAMTKFMIDYFAPEGTRIEEVAADLRRAEERLMSDERVTGIATYIGSGPPRFYLPVEPEEANPAYGQLIVNVRDAEEIPQLIDELSPWFAEAFPDAMVPLRQFGVGPSNTWKFEIRLSGPALADTTVLRAQAKKFVDILEANPLTDYVRIDWMQLVQEVVPVYSTERGRWAGVTRDDIARTTKRAYDGRRIGLYREGDKLIPILLRHVGEERIDVNGLPQLQVQRALATEPVPLSQVTDGILTKWVDPVIRRRDRRRTVKIQANPVLGVTMPMLREAVLGELDKVELPPGYKWEWGGEWESTVDSQAALIPGLIPAAVVVCFLIVLLYNAFRPLVIILLTIPLVIIGITAGLLAFDVPFGFMSLLGSMSLAGMMIKNIIVLLDEAEEQLKEGKARYDAIVTAAVSRLRPVVLAAATTVLGVMPLLQDVFWVGMAVAIMAGLTFGTVLTMVVVPTLYATLYRVPAPPRGAGASPPHGTPTAPLPT